MGQFSQIKLTSATPGGDAATYNLFDSTATGYPARFFAEQGAHKFIVDIKNSQAGTLKAYKSQDRGVTWLQIYQASVAAAAATSTNLFEFAIEPFADWKLDWLNGGSAQATWVVDMALSDDRSDAGSPTAGAADSSAAGADATANPTLVGRFAYLMGFNGTTWDRVRTGIVAKTATFTGLLNTLGMGRYNLAQPALTDGDVQLIQLDASGNTRQVVMNPAVAVDDTNGKIVVEHRYSFTNMTTATTTTIKSGAGLLHAIIINKAIATATITIYDNTAGSGTKIATITFGATLLTDPPLLGTYDVSFSTGLTVVTSGATDITLCYR